MRHFSIILLLASTMVASVRAANMKNLVQASLLADTTAIQLGQPFKLGVLLKITPQWHVYWLNCGDAGYPTTVKWKLPDGFTASETLYPVPKKIDQPGGVVVYGYEDEVMLVTTITPPAKIDSPNVTIEADPNWLVCQEMCVPGNAKLNITLPVGPTAVANKEIFDQYLSRLPMLLANADIENVQQQISGDQLVLTVTWKSDPPQDLQWFPPPSNSTNFGKNQIGTTGHVTTITSSFERLKGQKPDGELKSLLAFTLPAGRRGVELPVNLNFSALEPQKMLIHSN